MKKITLLIMLFTLANGFSQNLPYDFSTENQLMAGVGGATTSLEQDGANDVLQIVGATQPYDHARADFASPLDLSDNANNTLTFEIKPVNGTGSGSHLLKFESGAGQPVTELPFSTTGTDWQTITLNFGPNLVSYSSMILFIDFGDSNSGFSDTYLVDDISLGLDPAPTCDDGIQNGDETGVDCGGSSCAECVPITLPLDFSDASQLFTHVGDGDGGSVVLEDGKLRFNGNGQAYDQAYIDLSETFSLFDPSNNTFTVTMEPLLVPDGEVRTHLIKASIGAGAAVQLTGTSIGSAEQDVIFNFGTMGAEAWDRITIFMDFGPAPGGSTYNGLVTNYLISNISLGADPVIPDVEPTEAAPTPTRNAEDVISLFSDAYTDITSNRSPGWGEVVTAETHASNEVLKTTNFVPFTFTSPIDITGHTLHVDVWLPQLPSSGAGLLIKILDAANGPHEGNFIYPVANITAGQWNSIDIDINNFNQTLGTWDATAQGRVDQVLLDIVDDTTMYVDNIYFWKPPTAGLDDNVLNSVKMYPNPAKGVVNFSSASNVALDVAVYDMLGKQVLRANAVQSQLNISSLNPGMYFVKMTQGSNVSTKKLLVN